MTQIQNPQTHDSPAFVPNRIIIGEQRLLSDTLQPRLLFGHWILKFEIYLQLGAWDLGL